MQQRIPALLLLALAALAGVAALRSLVVAGELHLATGLLLIGVAGLGSWLAAEIAFPVLRASRETRTGVRIAVATTGVLLVGVELFLRFGLETHQSYSERNGAGRYEPPRLGGASWYHAYEPGAEAHWEFPEYVHLRRANSMGLHERELPLAKPPGQYRILALGDSFTEGMGSSQDATWVAVLERELRARLPGRDVVAINAGVAGSDPFFEYVLLRDRLLAYQPDLVVVAVNGTDVHDVAMRGGMERFLPDGSLGSRLRRPAWEWLYGISFLARHVVHDVLGYNYVFVTEDRWRAEQERAEDEIQQALGGFVQLGRQHGFQTAVAIHARDPGETREGRYGHRLGELATALADRGLAVVDVLAYWRQNDLMQGEDTRRYFWPRDGHHNAEGYAVLGRAVAEGLLALPNGPAASGPANDTGPGAAKR